jgi:chromosome segregation protein
MDQQVGQLQGRYLELSEDLARGDAPVKQQQADRDVLLKNRLDIEQRLAEARKQMDALENQRRGLDEQRQHAINQCDEVREQQNQVKLAARETELRLEGLQTRINELGAEVEALLTDLPEGDESQKVQAGLEALESQIRSLEPVNLAAIDEYTTEAERKTYLDQQNADLEEALATLEKAIEKIDRESRTRFKETFEQVNTRMGELFPRLFGGGHAHLEMIGSDWLNAGIAIMARPPGKRISRIHLMSGGEKALTAVSMVFAIFSLNPAPFCLLDEVDAPLDDANVGRFSDMVREMSEQVQFIVVTHNKVTMEVMTQMMGVTMREAGVSRLVSVDLDRAVSLAVEAS